MYTNRIILFVGGIYFAAVVVLYQRHFAKQDLQVKNTRKGVQGVAKNTNKGGQYPFLIVSAGTGFILLGGENPERRCLTHHSYCTASAGTIRCLFHSLSLNSLIITLQKCSKHIYKAMKRAGARNYIFKKDCTFLI
jgi:hypothetical protein